MSTNIPRVLFTSFKQSINDCSITKSVIEDWKNMNPNWEIIYFSDADLDEYYSNHPKFETYKFLKSGVAKADFFRICYIRSHGGLWFDVDLKPFSIDKIVSDTHLMHSMILFDSGHKNVSYMLIGGIDNNIMRITEDKIAQNINHAKVNKTKTSDVINVTGPHVLQQVIIEQTSLTNVKNNQFPATNSFCSELECYYLKFINKHQHKYNQMMKNSENIKWQNDKTTLCN